MIGISIPLFSLTDGTSFGSIDELAVVLVKKRFNKSEVKIIENKIQSKY